MHDTEPTQIIRLLLAEKGIQPPDGASAKDLLCLVLAADRLPGQTATTLAEAFDTMAERPVTINL